MSVHLDRSHQLAISHVGISQASNDADRPRQHCARLSARSKPHQQQPSAEIPHPFLNSKNAAPTFNSIATKNLPLFPANDPPPSVSMSPIGVITQHWWAVFENWSGKEKRPQPSSSLGSLLPTAGATGSGGAAYTSKYCHLFPIVVFLCNLLDRQNARPQIGFGHCQSKDDIRD